MKNKFFKITSLNSLGVIIKILTGVIISKLLAVFIGPQGIAIVGNLRDFTKLTLNIGSLSLEKGVLREASKVKGKTNDLKKLTTTLVNLAVLVSLILSSLIIIYSKPISLRVFGSIVYENVIVWAGITLPFFVIQTFLLNIINGIGKYSKIIWINIFAHIANLILMYLLTIRYNLEGSLLSIAFLPVLYLILTIIIAKKEFNLFYTINKSFFSIEILKKFGKYALIYIPSAIVFPLLYIFIRTYIIESLGHSDAGYYEAMNRISNNYMMFVSSLLTLYLLPELVLIEGKKNIKAKIVQFYKTILPLFIVGVTSIYLLKEYVILLLYTDEFLPMIILFKWQIAGDLLRMFSLSIIMIFHAKRMYIQFIISDLILALLLFISTPFFVSYYGLEGSGIAHLFTYILYFISVYILYFVTSRSNNFFTVD